MAQLLTDMYPGRNTFEANILGALIAYRAHFKKVVTLLVVGYKLKSEFGLIFQIEHPYIQQNRSVRALSIHFSFVVGHIVKPR